MLPFCLSGMSSSQPQTRIWSSGSPLGQEALSLGRREVGHYHPQIPVGVAVQVGLQHGVNPAQHQQPLKMLDSNQTLREEVITYLSILHFVWSTRIILHASSSSWYTLLCDVSPESLLMLWEPTQEPGQSSVGVCKCDHDQCWLEEFSLCLGWCRWVFCIDGNEVSIGYWDTWSLLWDCG